MSDDALGLDMLRVSTLYTALLVGDDDDDQVSEIP